MRAEPLPRRVLQVRQLDVERIGRVEIRTLRFRHRSLCVEQHEKVVGPQAVAGSGQLELLGGDNPVPLLDLHHAVGGGKGVVSRGDRRA